MVDSETFLITGASGFIGGWLAETLYLRDCGEVRAGIRDWSKAVRLARFPIPIALLDVMDSQQVVQAMKGVDRVIHTAYGSRQTTVEGTRNVLHAALKEGVKRFVYLSTTEVYGPVQGRIDETRRLEPTGGEYADSKIEAENLCWEYGERGLPVTVVRPTIVYGPFGRTWTTEMATKLQSGNWGVLEGHADGLCNLVYVSDLVDGILLAAQHPRGISQAFNLSGAETITWNEYFERYNAAMGLPPLRRIDPGKTRLRTTLMNPVRSAVKLAQKHFERPIRRVAQRSRQAKQMLLSAEKSIRTTPRAEDLELYQREALYAIDKARNLLGYRPRFGVDAGLALTAGWLEHAGLLDGVER